MDKGFTLIEMIVAVAVFSIVTTMALGSFLNVSDIQKKAMALRAVNDNLNFAVETMMREIRTGTDYCSTTCSPSSFNFTNSLGDLMVYALDGSVIKRSSNGGSFLSLTSAEVEIENLLFIVSGEEAGDNLQPIVTIIINGSSGEKEKVKSRLNLQTTISQRTIDS